MKVKWIKWKMASWVVCDKKCQKLKGMYHETIVQPTMLYGIWHRMLGYYNTKDVGHRYVYVKLDVCQNL